MRSCVETLPRCDCNAVTVSSCGGGRRGVEAQPKVSSPASASRWSARVCFQEDTPTWGWKFNLNKANVLCLCNIYRNLLALNGTKMFQFCDFYTDITDLRSSWTSGSMNWGHSQCWITQSEGWFSGNVGQLFLVNCTRLTDGTLNWEKPKHFRFVCFFLLRDSAV